MNINISQTMGSFKFESRENLKNTAKDILNRQNSSSEAMQRIIDETIFDATERMYPNAQLSIIKASTQMSVNNSLKETLKYLKNQAAKKPNKKPVLGEIWELFNNEESDDYKGELINFEIDSSLINIFAA